MNRFAPALSRCLICCLPLLIAAPSVAQKTLTVAADAHVTDNVTDRIPNHYNSGALPYLLAQNDPTRAYKIYLRFDLAEIAKAGPSGVRNATLRLNFSRFREQVGGTGTAAIEADTIRVYAITDNADLWTEGKLKGENSASDVTFTNAPHNDRGDAAKVLGAGTTEGASAHLIGSFSVVQDAPVGTEETVDATAFVNWALRGGAYGAAPGGDTDTQVTFILVHTAGNEGVPNNGVQFFSRENTAGPDKQTLPDMAPRLTYELASSGSQAPTVPPAVPGKSSLPSTVGTITTIVDAETLLVSGIGNVQLIGVTVLKDPARKPRPDDDVFGDDAVRATRRLAAGSRVRVEFEGKAAGTAPAWVFLPDGTLLNEQLIRRGYARMTPSAANTQYAARLRAAEQEARVTKRGLWPKQK